MDSVSPFTGPKLKAEWGRKRAKELAEALAAFAASKPYEARHTTGVGTSIAYVGDFPREIPLILGDAIHNLRTSLDLLACDLVTLATNGGSTKGVYFPFAESAGELDAMIKNKRFDRAGPDAVKLLHTIRPYGGGNLLLRALHDLDIMDKHKLIIPVGHQNKVTEIRSADPSVGIIVGSGASITMGEGSIIRVGNAAPSITVEPEVLFAPNSPEPVRGRVVLETLEEMAQLVLGIIQSFEALTVGHSAQSITTAGQRYSFGTGTVIPSKT